MTRGVVVLLALAPLGCEWVQVAGPDLERMNDQPRADPYEASPVFADGRAMRPPVPGAVARGTLLGPPEVVTGMRDGTPVERIPIPLTRALLDRGRERYDIFCAPCHGVAADGVSVVGRNMQLRAPPPLLADRTRNRPDGQLYAIVARGYGLMPGYDAQLTVEERWAVVAYVRALQLRAGGVRLSELPQPFQERLRNTLR